MEPFYWRGTTNFGDYMNHWLWPKLIPDLLASDDHLRLVGIGSLLKAELNFVQGKKIIFGTGSGYGDIPSSKAIEEWIVYFVRGPLTAQKLGLSADKAIVDGAWLISQVPLFSEVPPKKGTSFIPHWTTSQNGDWGRICTLAGINYIDPLGDFEKVISSIAKSELILAESLHGAILADYYRTPWVPIQISQQFLNFKWYDWCASVGLDFKVIKLPPSDFLESLFMKQNPYAIDYKYVCDLNPVCETYSCKEVNDYAPLFYKQKTVVKAILKKGYKSCLEKIKGHRDIGIFSAWNEKHYEKVALLLKRIQLEQPLLSEARVREEKIEKLGEKLAELINDYKKMV